MKQREREVVIATEGEEKKKGKKWEDLSLTPALCILKASSARKSGNL